MTKRNGVLSIRIVVAIFAPLLMACDSLYIPDPIDPRLPKYTERGNDVGGALVNGMLWKSTVNFDLLWGYDNRPVLRYDPYQNNLEIAFAGYLEDDNPMTISFKLGSVGVLDNLAAMKSLKGKKFALGPGENTVSISSCETNAVSGQLYLRSIQYHSQDDYLILSGTFGFTIQDPVCGDMEITYGRFDFEVYRMD